MKKIINLLLFALLTFFPFMNLLCYTNLTPAEVHTRLAQSDTLFLLDVREISEYRNGHIAEPDGLLPITPINMPWNTGILSVEYNRLPADIDIIVYCQSGGRSAAASSFLETMGFTRIYNMTGGFSSWTYEWRNNGYGDHSGNWVHVTDPEPVEIICTETEDTSKIIFPGSAIPNGDSIYIEFHFASLHPFLPPDVPVSDMEGLFRISVLDEFGISMFEGDSIRISDNSELIFSPIFQSNILFDPKLKVFVPGEAWRKVEHTILYFKFNRIETILRRWYNCEGFKTTDVQLSMGQPENFDIKVYPNPFNGSVKIEAPKDAVISVYDTRGRLVERLNSTIWSPKSSVSSGVYIIKADSNNRTALKNVVYLK